MSLQLQGPSAEHTRNHVDCYLHYLESRSAEAAPRACGNAEGTRTGAHDDEQPVVPVFPSASQALHLLAI